MTEEPVLVRAGAESQEALASTPCRSLGDLCERFRAWHLPRLSTSCWYRYIMERHLRLLYALPLERLEKPVIVAWWSAIGRTHPQAANNALVLLKSVLNRGREWGLYAGPDPTQGIRRFRTFPRARFLTETEWGRVRPILDHQPPKIRVYFYVLLMTGARMSELRLMEWRYVDLMAGLWSKPQTKSGRTHLLPLNSQVCLFLRELPQDSRFVFHGDPRNGKSKPDQPWSRRVVFAHWQKIRTAAGVEDVTIHDLRRTLASWLTMNGENLAVVQSVLDHRNIQTTMIYARLNQGPVRVALEQNARRMLGVGATSGPSQS